MKKVHQRPYLRELFGNSSEHQIVQVPCLSQVLHIPRSLVFSAPILGFHKVTAISLKLTKKAEQGKKELSMKV